MRSQHVQDLRPGSGAGLGGAMPGAPPGGLPPPPGETLARQLIGARELNRELSRLTGARAEAAALGGDGGMLPAMLRQQTYARHPAAGGQHSSAGYAAAAQEMGQQQQMGLPPPGQPPPGEPR